MPSRQTLAQLDLRIGVQAGDLSRELNNIERTVKRKSGGIKRALGGIGAGFAAVGAAAAGLGIIVRDSLETAAALQDAADAADIGVERFQSLGFAFEQTGASSTQFEEAMRRLNRRLGLFVSTGGGPAAQAFKTLGISVRDANGQVRPTEAVFDDITTALGKLGSQAEVSAAASAFFGETAGPVLAVLLGQGGSAVADLEQKARDLGIVMREDLVARAAEADEKFGALATVLRRRVVGAVVENAAAIDDLAQSLIDLIPQVVEGTSEFLRFWGIIDRSPLGRLDREIAQIENRLKGLRELEGIFGGDSGEIARLEKLLARLKAERAALSAEGPVRFAPEDQRLIAGQDRGLTPRVTGGEPAGDGKGEAEKGADDRIAAQQRAVREIRALEIELLSITGQTVAAIKLQQQDRIDALERELARGDITEQQFARKREILAEITSARIKGVFKDETATAGSLLEQFGQRGAETLADLALAGELSAKRIGKAFLNMGLDFLFGMGDNPLEGLFNGGGGGFRIPGLAGGGRVSPHQFRVVGERGPERRSAAQVVLS